MNFRASLLGATVLLSACQNMPEPYAPPVQRLPFENARAHRTAVMVIMSDPAADHHVVQDIPLKATGTWRWVGKKPAVRVKTRASEDQKYVIDFTIADATLKDTGPVTLSFYVNDHLLDTVRYDKAGAQHFEKPVPKEWLVTGNDAILAAEIDKVWVAPDDGAKLGFILSRIGLAQ